MELCALTSRQLAGQPLSAVYPKFAGTKVADVPFIDSDVKAIATKWLDWKTLGPLAAKYQAVIADEVKLDTRKLDSYDAFQAGVAALKTFADERRAYLLAYVDRTPAR